MSMMSCTDCGEFVDTDDDPKSLYMGDYFEGYEDTCICEMCRHYMVADLEEQGGQ